MPKSLLTWQRKFWVKTQLQTPGVEERLEKEYVELGTQHRLVEERSKEKNNDVSKEIKIPFNKMKGVFTAQWINTKSGSQINNYIKI